MSDILANAHAAPVPAARWSRRWRLPLPMRRNLAVLRRILRNYWLQRATTIFLTRADERLLYDVGIEPLDLIEAVRKARGVHPAIDPIRKG
ncbi:hypothetical protein NIM87_04780 [Devosia sp. XJ19-1]|uniref:DUF1127 domain-containing protein n=1 Tax=Devosia ureilytica TaxID=2952754 RepID=A0A9Q4AN46_9HYPH|nr:hypothetical protein [Devosia ureilytica]MCP8882803.1 hypothetical protein [Devosia ureilytica]MCP8886829.1 hypothetical protein [Devosia ureilytica]